jgi:hypothetical protein
MSALRGPLQDMGAVITGQAIEGGV